MQPCGVIRLGLFRMRCYRPVARCGGHAIPILRAHAPTSRTFLASAASLRKRGHVQRAVAEETSASPQSSGELEAHVSKAYPFADIESKWQRYWDENSTFRTPHEVDTSKPKYYVLDMFPYPRCSTLAILHVQHEVSWYPSYVVLLGCKLLLML